jgi:glycosyltransferase involved in cell wall biosynthesis
VPTQLTYAAVTPARNEAENLERLAACMARQSLLPEQWLLVDNGSTDDTPAVIAAIVDRLPFAAAISVPNPAPTSVRGRPIVAAFHAGLAALVGDPAVIVKLDADVSFDDAYFERLVCSFAEDPKLGIASGICYELAGGEWRPQHTTRDHVRGATRAYRKECLQQVLPLEERMGWDGIDELKAQVNGWRTASLAGLRFDHHRALGEREQSWSKWVGQGDMAHYMGYRFSYLLARTSYRMAHEPAAAGMVWGYLTAVAGRRARYPDEAVRRHLRRQQGVGALPARISEALGRVGRRSGRSA